jgi:hypothetical protein
MITTYEHHGRKVFVQEHLKGTHRQNCLCFSLCQNFKPGTEENCEIAKELYLLCVKHGLTTPVFECPNYAEPTGGMLQKEHLTII